MTNDLERLKSVLSDEQIRQLVDMVSIAHERAVTRQYGQSAHVFFNQHGHPTEFGVTDNVRGIVPRKVTPLE